MKVLCRAWFLAQKLRALGFSKDIVPFVDGLGTDYKWGHVTERSGRFFDHEVPVYNRSRIEEVRGERGVTALGRISFNGFFAVSSG